MRAGPPWPTRPQTLLLHAALASGDAAGAAWEQWRRDGGDVDAVDFSSFRLLPLLYRNLLANGIEDPELPRLKGIYRHSWYSNKRLFQHGEEALRLLNAADLETIVLKGAALDTLYYEDAGARPMEDFDVLVRTRSGRAALDALEGAGWAPDGGPTEHALASHHGVSLTALTAPPGTTLDLHWRALLHAARDDDFWEAAVPMRVGQTETKTLGHTDHLLHVCVHALSPGLAPVRWVADAVTIVRVAGPELDWDRLAKRAIARRVTLPARAALRYLRDAFALPVPQEVLDELRTVRPALAERWGFRATTGASSRAVTPIVGWEEYRRLRTAEHDSPVPEGYLRFLANKRGLARRRDLVPHLARKLVEAARSRGTQPGERAAA